MATVYPFARGLLFFDRGNYCGFFGAARTALHRGRAPDALAQARGGAHHCALDVYYAASEFHLQLYGWDRPRRFVVIREQLRAERASLGRKLLDVPGYTFRLFVTNLSAPPEEIWRDYNHRADMENRIAELKHDLAADRFLLAGVLCHRGGFPQDPDAV